MLFLTARGKCSIAHRMTIDSVVGGIRHVRTPWISSCHTLVGALEMFTWLAHDRWRHRDIMRLCALDPLVPQLVRL